MNGRRIEVTEDGEGGVNSSEGELESGESGTGSELLTGSCSSSSERRSGEDVRGDTGGCVP